MIGVSTEVVRLLSELRKEVGDGKHRLELGGRSVLSIRAAGGPLVLIATEAGKSVLRYDTLELDVCWNNKDIPGTSVITRVERPSTFPEGDPSDGDAPF